MTIDENRQLVRRYYEEIVNTGNVDDIERFVSPNYVETDENIRYPVGLEGQRHTFSVCARRILICLQIDLRS